MLGNATLSESEVHNILLYLDRRDAEGEVRHGAPGEAEAEGRAPDAAAQVSPLQAPQRVGPRVPRHLAGLLRVRRETRQLGYQGTRMRSGRFHFPPSSHCCRELFVPGSSLVQFNYYFLVEPYYALQF